MTYNNIFLNTNNHITTITINRPNKLNALNIETIAELHEAFKTLENDRNTKVIIVTGSGEKDFVEPQKLLNGVEADLIKKASVMRIKD